MRGLVETPFKLTLEEILSSAAITICLLELIKVKTPQMSLEDTCFTPQYGFTASASLEPCGPRFVRITDIKGGAIDWNQVPYCECTDYKGYELASGDILIARSGSIGKTFLVTDIAETAVFASYMIRLITKSDFVPSYIYWCLQSQQFWLQIMEAHRGSAMKNINGKMLTSLRFPIPTKSVQRAIVVFLECFRERLRGINKDLPELPPPLTELKRIVARIGELAAKVEEARGLRRDAVEEAEKLLPSAVAQTLANVGSDFREVTVESVAHSVTDGDHQPPPKADFGIPFIFINHIVKGYINFSGCKWVSLEYFNAVAASRKPGLGDVLYTAVGSYGVPCLVETDEPFCFQRHIAIIKPNQNYIIPAYLKWALSSSNVFEQATRAATGSAQLTVPLRSIRKLTFNLPALPEQRRIVAYLDNLQARKDALKQLQVETSMELDALLPSILDKAFRGEL